MIFDNEEIRQAGYIQQGIKDSEYTGQTTCQVTKILKIIASNESNNCRTLIFKVIQNTNKCQSVSLGLTASMISG
jgi:hypothetical protein